MAIACSSYKSFYADVAENGWVNNGGAWKKCGFLKALENNKLSLPSARCLTGGVKSIPFVLIGDDAFILKPKMRNLNSQQNSTTAKTVHNYRHSRGRRLLENLFGILASRYHFSDTDLT